MGPQHPPGTASMKGGQAGEKRDCRVAKAHASILATFQTSLPCWIFPFPFHLLLFFILYPLRTRVLPEYVPRIVRNLSPAYLIACAFFENLETLKSVKVKTNNFKNKKFIFFPSTLSTLTFLKGIESNRNVCPNGFSENPQKGTSNTHWCRRGSRSSSSLTSFPPFFFSRLFVTLPRHTIRPQARAFPVISAFRLSCVSLILFIEPFYVYIRRS